MAAVDVLTPVLSSGRSRRLENVDKTPTTNDILSPATRRRAGLGGQVSYLPTSAMNDDAAEQQERMKSRLAQLHQKGLASPATQSERRISLTMGNLSSTQLSEHYANCIKLSAENKISAKNAFGLHLIDYMGELLRKQEYVSFQVASSTLDASAKIYAGRVDAIHSETFKILGNLGHGSEAKQSNEDNDETVAPVDGDEVGGETNAAEKKRKRAKKSKTIETNLRNINMAGADADCEANSLLLHKAWAAFEGDQSSTLLLSHLRCHDDSCVLTLDSGGSVKLASDAPPASGTDEMVMLGEFSKLLQADRLAEVKVCPTYCDFRFTNWKNDGSKSSAGDASFVGAADTSLEMTMRDTANAAGDDDDDNEVNDLPADDFQHMPDNDDEDGEDGDNNARMAANNGDTVAAGSSKEAQLIDLVVKDIRQGKVDSLMQIIAAQPSDYSYFNCPLLNTWAGPQHWKMKAMRKETAADAAKKTVKGPKEVFSIDHAADSEELEAHLKKTRAATCLSKAAMSKYDKSRCLLPEDLHYNVDDLCKLFQRPDVLLRRQPTVAVAGYDDIDQLRENGAHDQQSYFCPPLALQGEDTLVPNTQETADGGDSDDEDGGVDFHFDADDGADTMLDPGLLQQTALASVDGLMLNGTLVGDNLIAAPRKVEQIDIAYAKTAKRIDVKKLKTAMWSVVSKQAESGSNSSSTKAPDAASSTSSFASVLKRLGTALPSNMVSNLSVPIAFVCLLHIANEKNLFITSTEQFSDLNIAVERS